MVQRLRCCVCVIGLLLPAGARAQSGLMAPGATLNVVYYADGFFEGPTWDPFTGRLYFSSLSSNQIFRLDSPGVVDYWFNGTQGINGTFLSNQGRLLVAQGGALSIVDYAIGFDGPEDARVLAHDPAWQMPNDLCQTSQGHIYFTTPSFSGVGDSFVYHLTPNGTVTPAVTDMSLPNGVIASGDAEVLYVADSSAKHWRHYPIRPDGSVGAGSLFFNPGVSDTADPDGMTMDEFGNLYLNGRGGLWIVSPAGESLGYVDVPVFNTNATFGGFDGRTLFITGDKFVYELQMNVRGAFWRDIPPENQPPVIEVTAPIMLTSRDRENFVPPIAIHDDGIPGTPLQYLWRQTAGPLSIISDSGGATPPVTLTLPGVYTYEVIVFDGGSSVRRSINLTMFQAADYDRDNDVDNADHILFLACRGQSGAPVGPECIGRDLDGDADVDQSDFGVFQRCLAGSGHSADPACAD